MFDYQGLPYLQKGPYWILKIMVNNKQLILYSRNTYNLKIYAYFSKLKINNHTKNGFSKYFI